MLFFVKRKSAYSFCHEDESNSKSTLSMLTRTSAFDMKSSLNRLPQLTATQCVLQFTKHICEVNEMERKVDFYNQFSLVNFCEQSLLENLAQESQELALLHLALWKCVSLIMAGCSLSSAVWDFRLLLAFHQQHFVGAHGRKGNHLLNPELFAFFVQGVETMLEPVPTDSSESQGTDEMDLG